MNALKQEALQLIEDAKNIADNIDNDEISLADRKHEIALICRRYATLYQILTKEKER